MSIRFVTRHIQAHLDYAAAISLMSLPFLLSLGASNLVANWLAVATGIAAFILTVLTDYELGVFLALPYWFHVAVDRLVELVFVAEPFVLDFTGLAAICCWAAGAAVLLVTFVLNAAEASSAKS